MVEHSHRRGRWLGPPIFLLACAGIAGPVLSQQDAAGVQSIQAAAEEDAGARQEFEQLVRSTYPGTFFLFRKLPDAQRQRVFEAYQEDGDIERVRKAIISFVRGRLPGGDP